MSKLWMKKMKNLQDRLWEDFDQFYEIAEGQDLHLLQMASKYGAKQMYLFLYQGLRTDDCLEFGSMLGFVSYIHKNRKKLVNAEMNELIKKMDDLHLIENLFQELMDKKAYGYLDDFIEMIPSLPIDFTKERVLRLIAKYKVENPVMFVSLISLYSNYDRENIENVYDSFVLHDKKLEFIIKFYVAGLYRFFNGLQLREKLIELRNICPEEYSDDLEKYILVNENVIQKYGPTEKPQHVPNEFFRIPLTDFFSEYFVENSIINGKGRFIKFDDYLKTAIA